MPDVPRVDDTIKQGAPWDLFMTIKDDNGAPVNLTGYKGRMQIREAPNGDLIVELTTTTQPSGFSAGNGKMVLGGAAGTIASTLTKADTAALAFERATYDLFLFDGADLPIPIIEGILTLDPQVTTTVAP